MWTVSAGATSHVPRPPTTATMTVTSATARGAAERDRRAEDEERHRVADQVIPAGVQERRERDALEAVGDARHDAVALEVGRRRSGPRSRRSTSPPPSRRRAEPADDRLRGGRRRPGSAAWSPSEDATSAPDGARLRPGVVACESVSTDDTARLARAYFDTWTDRRGPDALRPLLAEDFVFDRRPHPHRGPRGVPRRGRVARARDDDARRRGLRRRARLPALRRGQRHGPDPQRRAPRRARRGDRASEIVGDLAAFQVFMAAG